MISIVMTRRIICKPCAEKTPEIHPEDAAMGWQRRMVELVVGTPPGHGYDTKEGRGRWKHHAMTKLVCDACGDTIPDGAVAVAMTMWLPRREGEPDNWEAQYGGAPN